MGLFSKSSQKESVVYKKVEPEPVPKPPPTATAILPTSKGTTGIREARATVSWTIQNWKALAQTGIKELRSPIYPIYVTANRNDTDRDDNIVHKYVM